MSMRRAALTILYVLSLLTACRDEAPTASSRSSGESSAAPSVSSAPPAVAPPVAVPCGERAGCLHDGLCQPDGEGCVAKTDADCERSQQCRAFKRCKAEGGRCVHDLSTAPAYQKRCDRFPLTDASPEPVTPCSVHGECELQGDRCAAKNDASCKASDMCGYRGRCTAKEGRCVASSAEACASSGACCWEGACTLDGESCIAETDADCSSSALCLAEGRCEARAGRCVVTRTEHCRSSRGCRDYGRCVAKEGRCVGSDDEGCRESLLCKRDGLCSGGEQDCVARGKDCEQAVVCKVLGRCRAAHEGCFVPSDDKGCRGFHGSRGKTPCFDFGECTEQDGLCVATSDARCAVSTLCRFQPCAVEGHRCRVKDGPGRLRLGNELWVPDDARCWHALVNDRKDSLDEGFHGGLRLPRYGMCLGLERKQCELFKSKPDPPLMDPPEPFTPH